MRKLLLFTISFIFFGCSITEEESSDIYYQLTGVDGLITIKNQNGAPVLNASVTVTFDNMLYGGYDTKDVGKYHVNIPAIISGTDKNRFPEYVEIYCQNGNVSKSNSIKINYSRTEINNDTHIYKGYFETVVTISD